MISRCKFEDIELNSAGNDIFDTMVALQLNSMNDMELKSTIFSTKKTLKTQLLTLAESNQLHQFTLVTTSFMMIC